MGSDSDFPVVSPAIRRLKQFGILVEARVMSAHRTPEAAAEFSKNAEKDGFGVIIAAAGKAAHLAGVLAAHTTLPVIGIPVKSSTLDGLDARGQCCDFGGADAGAFRREHRKAAAPDEGGYGAGCYEKERSLAAESCRAIIREG